LYLRGLLLRGGEERDGKRGPGSKGKRERIKGRGVGKNLFHPKKLAYGPWTLKPIILALCMSLAGVMIFKLINYPSNVCVLLPFISGHFKC